MVGEATITELSSSLAVGMTGKPKEQGPGGDGQLWPRGGVRIHHQESERSQGALTYRELWRLRDSSIPRGETDGQMTGTLLNPQNKKPSVNRRLKVVAPVPSHDLLQSCLT